MSEEIEVENENAGVKLACVDEPRLRESLRANKIRVGKDVDLPDLVGPLVAYYDGQKKSGTVMCQCDRCNGVAPEALNACPFCGEPNDTESTDRSEVDLISAPTPPDAAAESFPELPRVTRQAAEAARVQLARVDDARPAKALVALQAAHEAAAIFPLLDDEELAPLTADIREHGLQHPIVIYEGKILDGRNRARACELAGVAPVFVEYAGDPIAYVLSQNLHRRHLTTSQRAAVAVDVKRRLEGRAKERQKAGGNKAGVGRAKLPEPAERPREQAAKALKVSERSVQDAEKIAVETPEEFERIKRGETTVGAARKRVTKATPKKPRRRPWSQEDAIARIDRAFGVMGYVQEECKPWAESGLSFSPLLHRVRALQVEVRALQVKVEELQSAWKKKSATKKKGSAGR